VSAVFLPFRGVYFVKVDRWNVVFQTEFSCVMFSCRDARFDILCVVTLGDFVAIYKQMSMLKKADSHPSRIGGSGALHPTRLSCL
jgi:hypothetical protein